MTNPFETTIYFDDFVVYHWKAQQLQKRDRGLDWEDFDDPLMKNIPIYDVVERKYAGFSNLLEDLKGVRSPADQARLAKFESDDLRTWLYLFFIHRFTGSGASFEKDHGYRNSIIPALINSELSSTKVMSEAIIKYIPPVFTSIGNQPPGFPKDPKYRLAFHNFLDNRMEDLLDFSMRMIEANDYLSITDVVDELNQFNAQHSIRRFNFQYTAVAMDIAEYYPDIVDPGSHCYMGNNAEKALNLMFKKTGRMKKHAYTDICMDEIVRITGNKPYNLEDVLCDYIRYITEYVPAHGFEHLTKEQTSNSSITKGRI